MKLEQLFGSERDRAVSPVIGVVLMLTATVIIGGVVAAFVTGMGSGLSSAPQASFDFDYDATESNLTITHDGGESIAANELVVKNGTSTNVGEENLTGVDTVSTGDEIVVSGIDNDSTVKLVWEDPDGDQTAKLGEWSGPNA